LPSALPLTTERQPVSPGSAQAPPSERSHRPALDGLRALAVLAVIAYHLGSNVHGGFLGVDAFFVLSGYLITSLLVREHASSGRINFARFWLRRARRLLPAVLVLVAVVAWHVAATAPITTYAARRADLLSTLFYYANWHFIAVSQSYFAQFTAGVSPLEHMWSLSIEEQFYLTWPVLLLVVVWVAKRRIWPTLAIIGLAAVASAALMAARYTAIDPTRAYIGTDTRAFELLVGAALAVLIFKRRALLRSERLGGLARWGLPIVAAGAAVFVLRLSAQSSLYFRGGGLVFALLVAAGIAGVEAVPRSFTGRVLSLRPLAWLGRVSYGVYLWHWPIIVWTARTSASWNPRVREVGLTAAAIAAGALSYYVVERPIRYGRLRWPRRASARPVVASAASLMIVGAVLGFSLSETSVPSRGLAGEVALYGGRFCPLGSPEPYPGFAWCRYRAARPGEPTLALAGDSTAAALDYGMNRFTSRHGWGYVMAAEDGCSVLPLMFPFTETSPYQAKAARCVQGVRAVLASVQKTIHPNIWVIADRWMLEPLRLPDGTVLPFGNPRRTAIITSALTQTLRGLTADGSRVAFVITPPPAPPIQCALNPAPSDNCNAVSYSEGDRQTAIARAIVQHVALTLRGRVYAVNIDDIVCERNGHCPVVVDGHLGRVDTVHWGYYTSLFLAPRIIAHAERLGLRAQ
jgi:peptidoglycan/LPS O-acetylase OafA/YrhL